MRWQALITARVAQAPDGADKEGPVLLRGNAHLGHVPEPDLGHLPVGGKVVLAAQHVVVDPGRMRDIDPDAQLDPAFPCFPLIRLVVFGHRVRSLVTVNLSLGATTSGTRSPMPYLLFESYHGRAEMKGRA